MSRPPKQHFRRTTTGAPVERGGRFDYLPSEFADFVQRQRELAAPVAVTSGEGDFGETLFELSAVLGHVLGVYQDRYAGEAFLSTAQSPRSLVRHGRRLGYEPDPGIAATGFVVLSVGAGLRGLIPKGLPLGSVPVGEKRAQDYETLRDLTVDAALNRLQVADAIEPVQLSPTSRFELDRRGLRLERGDRVLIETSPGRYLVRTVVSAEETREGTTWVTVDPPLPSSGVAGFRLHAKPALELRALGWDSPASEIPGSALVGGALPAALPTVGSPTYGYLSSDPQDVAIYADENIFLTPPPDKPLSGPILRILGDTAQTFSVAGETRRTLAFHKVEAIATQTITGWIPGFSYKNAYTDTDSFSFSIAFVGITNNDTDVYMTTVDQQGQPIFSITIEYITTGVQSPVSAARIVDENGVTQRRSAQDIRSSVWYADWRASAGFVQTRPSTAAPRQPVALAGLYPELDAGHYLALSTRDGDPRRVGIVEVTSVDRTRGRAELSWRWVDPAAGITTLTLGDLVIRGNVAKISHGRSVDQALGDSDGATPFLRFELGDTPLTFVPSAAGGEPALEVRVGGVVWARVPDFYESGPDDRHYVLQHDERGGTIIIFGDGRHGAVPPAGKRHITAAYRMGQGEPGNAEPGEINRIKKAHPLLDAVVNPRPIAGGADRAAAEDVRLQATRWVQTFDRAVSVADHAALALLFPGVTRANARWTSIGAPTPRGVRVHGVEVIAATATGRQPDVQALTAFLDARRDLTVPLSVIGPTEKPVRIAVAIETDPAFLAADVRDAVRAVLYGADPAAPGMFTFPARALGQPAFLSEVYAAVSAVPGVSFVQVRRFDLGLRGAPASAWRVLDVIPIQPNEWLSLAADDFTFPPVVP